MTLAAISLTAATTQRSFAGSSTAIYYAASNYRESVREFEQAVLRSPEIGKPVERLVNRLEDSTDDLKLAARDHRRFDRLCDCFIKTDALHARVQLAFFGNPLYRPAPELEFGWGNVVQCYGELVREIRYLQELRQARRRGRPPLPIIDHNFDDAPVTPSVDQLGELPFAPVTGLAKVQSTGRLNLRTGANLQRTLSPSAEDRSAPTQAPLVRHEISTHRELRSAVIGALLQRQ